MKKLAVVLGIILAFIIILTVGALNIQEKDAEYEPQVAEIMKDYASGPAAAREALASIGVELIGEPVTVEHFAGQSAGGSARPDYSLSVYGTRRSGSQSVYLQWILQANATDYFPGPLDYISLEWDTNRASYYSTYADGEISTVRGRSSGIVLFNIEDDKLNSGEYAYGTVQVEPLAEGWMDYGSKYVHTYTTFLFEGSASFAFGPSISISDSDGGSLGLSYTFGYTVSVGTNTSKWQIWADNAVNLS